MVSNVTHYAICSARTQPQFSTLQWCQFLSERFNFRFVPLAVIIPKTRGRPGGKGFAMNR